MRRGHGAPGELADAAGIRAPAGAWQDTGREGSRLKVLFLSHPFLYPMDTGGKIRTGHLLRHLRGTFDLALVSTIESPRDDTHLSRMSQLCSSFHPVLRGGLRKYSTRFYLSVLSRMLSRYPVSVLSDYSVDVRRKLKALLSTTRFDLLICDFLQPSINLLDLDGPPRLLFQHNVESMILKRHSETTANPLLRLFWRRQWRKMARYERLACQRFDGVVTVSEMDKAILEGEFGARKVFAIPTGVDTDFFRPDSEPTEDGSLIFVGSMDWIPNEDAILFFATHILPRIRAVVPAARLSVVGRNPSRRLRHRLQAHPGIHVVGRVDDVRPFIARHAVYVIPLRIAGGTRIKAYEAMAMGKPIVSTRIGLEGLPVADGVHALIADGPDDLAASVVRLLNDAAERRRLGHAARLHVEHHASWAHAAEIFASACHSVVRV